MDPYFGCELLQFGQKVEWIGLLEFCGIDQAHEQVANKESIGERETIRQLEDAANRLSEGKNKKRDA
ncbi:MAG: hypothetical protein JW793_15110 [Acidobacteria bacterium]|nr:hypothetical protein [Acidobacteriota bacterium]